MTARPAGATRDNPFALLGLRPDDELTDDDVRAAWRRIAAASHPDRADGGDPDLFASAALAYTLLRTSADRAEARAILPALRAGRARAGRHLSRRVKVLGRILLAAAAVTAALVTAGSDPAGPALAVGAVTWLVVTSRRY